MPSQRPDVVEGGERRLGDPASASREDGVDRRPGRASAGCRPARGACASPTSVSQQPIEPQRQARPSGLTVQVADLAGKAGDAGQQAPVDDQAAADADLARHVQDVVDADGRAAPRLAEDARVGVVGDRDRDGGPSARARRAPSGTSIQPRLGAIDTRPSLRRTTPATATPMPTIGQSSRAGRSATQGREVGDDVVDRELAAGRSTRTARASRRRGRRSRPRSSRRGSRGSRTAAPSGFSRTSGEGRPGVPSGTARSSVTRPAAASSPTSARIALRVRPVAATSSERERGPCSWRPRTMALRFAR